MSVVESPFNIMCKPACGRCNLNCAYCYYTMKPQDLYPGVKRFAMSDEVLENYTRQYLEAQPIRCEFGWQGGEPTLMGLDFFRKAVAFQKKYGNPMQQVTNSLQTNGTLLTDEWCRFLAENNFLVGISLDGPPQWHDTFRRDHHDKPSFHKAWRGLELCRRYGVEFNVLVTLNSVNAPHAGDIYRYFTNRGIHYLQFIPILERTEDGTPTPFSCTPEQFGDVATEVFDLWRRRDVGTVSVRLIDSVLHSILFGRASTCCYSERCANAHIVEWNGDVYVCDHFVFEEWNMGNLMERPLSELVTDPLLETFASLKTDLPDMCRNCEYLDCCHGGCPKHHMPIGTDPARTNYYCAGLKRFFARAVPELKKIAPYIQKGQVPPDLQDAADSVTQSRSVDSVMPEAGLPEAPPAAGPGISGRVGRNDPCPCGSGKKYKQCCGRRG